MNTSNIRKKVAILLERLKIKNKRQVFWVITIVVGFFGGILSAALIKNQVIFRSKAGPGPAVLTVSPTTQNINIGTTGTFDIFINPNGASVSGVQIVMTYDPNLVKIDSITPGAFFNSDHGSPQIVKSDLTVSGKIVYALMFPNESNHYSTSEGVAATVNFTTISGGVSTLSFITDTSQAIHTKVSDVSGLDVIDTATGGQINVASGAKFFFNSLTPPNPQVVGSTFSIKAMMDTDGQNVEGFDARIIFDPNVLEATAVSQSTEAKFSRLIAMDRDNTNGIVYISESIGDGSSAVPVSGSEVNAGTITFKVKQATVGTDVSYDFTLGDRNDSNIVLAGSASTLDPIDILSSVVNQSIVTGTVPTNTPTPTTTTMPTTTATPTPTTTATAPPITPTPTTTAGPQGMTIRVMFQGRTRPGTGNIATMEFTYVTRDLQGNITGTPVTQDVTTGKNGEFGKTLNPGLYKFLIKPGGYLARLFDKVEISAGDSYIDLSGGVFLGGDLHDDRYNSDGEKISEISEVNEVDYTLGFIEHFGSSDAMADIDGSGQVNSLDFSIMRNNWSLVDNVLQ